MRPVICIQKSNNIEIMMISETDDIIDELFESFCKNIKED